MFGDRTTSLLRKLSVGVAGVSGSGSPSIEMLMRLG
jgi:tRNA A37 threonylcarbamoyladenosine dehydratase